MPNLYRYFHDAARRCGSETALEVDGLVLTYAGLRAAAEGMAAHLLATLGRRPVRVGLLTSRSPSTYAAYLGILRLGAAVVALNPYTTTARNVAMSRAAAVDATVVDETSGPAARDYARIAGVPVVDLSGGLPPQRGQAGPEWEPAGDVAYIGFTSGSTGAPKGVPITHRNICAFVDDALSRHGYSPGCRVAQSFELSFDPGVNEVLGAWAAGGTVCVVPREEVLSPAPFVGRKGITHLLVLPSMASFALGDGGLAPGSMPSLQRLLLGGEPVTTELAAGCLEAAPNAVLHNCYGPTELTILCADYRLPGESARWPVTSNGTLPIGAVYPQLEHIVLDADLRPADDGELCVRGPQRFRGYLDPVNDAGRFLSFDGGAGEPHEEAGSLTEAHWYRTGDRVRREDGRLVHVGRLDAQVKIDGFRVEPGEVESALRRHAGVADAVVVAVGTPAGGRELHAVYTGVAVPAAELARIVADLPPHMRPRGYVRRDSIPLTLNGKVDRALLLAELIEGMAIGEGRAGNGRP